MFEETYQVHPDLAGNVPIAPTTVPVAQVPLEISQQALVAEEEKPLLGQEYETENEETQQPVYGQSRERAEDHTNFRSLREATKRETERAERAERDRERLERERDRLEAQLAGRPSSNKNAQEQDQYVNDSEDVLVTGSQLNSYQKRLQQERQQDRAELAATQQKLTDALLAVQYPDIRRVLSEENIRAFSQMKPQLAQGLSLITDYETKVVATYQAMKDAGVVMEDSYVKDRARVQANVSKPKNMNTISPQVGESPLTRANVFANTDDSPAAQLKRYEEMMKYADRRG